MAFAHPESAKNHAYSPLDTQDLQEEQAQDESHDALVYMLEQSLRAWKRRVWILSLLSTVLLCTTTSMVFYMANANSNHEILDVSSPYTPVSVDYHRKWMTDEPSAPMFTGQPRKEMDEAWEDLLKDTLIRFSAEELLLAGNATSVTYEDGGFVGGLGVSHDLHCLKRIHQYIHKDYYYTGDQDWQELEKHASHCVEAFRLGMICRPDLSMYLLEWTPHSRTMPSVRIPQQHRCVDWEQLRTWMKGRAAEFGKMAGPDPALFDQPVQPHKEPERTGQWN